MSADQDQYVNDLGQDWRDYFDEVASGRMCQECSALVPARPEHMFNHMAWHAKITREFSHRPRLI